MEILPLGVGGAFAKTLQQTNFLITPAQGAPFLIDVGHTATRVLHHLGIDLRSVSQVILSHLHADHIGGLEELGFTGYFVWGEKARLHVPESLLPWLWPHCLEGGMGQRLKGADGEFFASELSTYFAVYPMDTAKCLHFGSVEVTPFRTPHIPGRPSYGFVLYDAVTGGRAMLTCDSKFSRRNLERYGQDVSVIFHDCQLNGEASGVHALLNELMTLPEAWQEKILLVHYGDEWPRFVGQTGKMRLAQERKAIVL